MRWCESISSGCSLRQRTPTEVWLDERLMPRGIYSPVFALVMVGEAHLDDNKIIPSMTAGFHLVASVSPSCLCRILSCKNRFCWLSFWVEFYWLNTDVRQMIWSLISQEKVGCFMCYFFTPQMGSPMNLEAFNDEWIWFSCRSLDVFIDVVSNTWAGVFCGRDLMWLCFCLVGWSASLCINWTVGSLVYIADERSSLINVK